MFEWVRHNKITEETGLTKRQIETRRFNGTWINGVHYKMFSDKTYWYNVPAIRQWQAEQARAA